MVRDNDGGRHLSKTRRFASCPLISGPTVGGSLIDRFQTVVNNQIFKYSILSTKGGGKLPLNQSNNNDRRRTQAKPSLLIFSKFRYLSVYRWTVICFCCCCRTEC